MTVIHSYNLTKTLRLDEAKSTSISLFPPSGTDESLSLSYLEDRLQMFSTNRPLVSIMDKREESYITLKLKEAKANSGGSGNEPFS